MPLLPFQSPHKSQDTWTIRLFLVLVVVLALVVCVTASVPIASVKIAVGGILTALVALAFAVTTIRTQTLAVPRSYVLIAAWALPLAYGVATLFASDRTISAYGNPLSMDSFAFILIGVLLLSLAAMVFNTQKRVLQVYLTLVGTVAALSVLEIVLFFARPWVAGTGIILPSLSLLGSLNDLSVFFGLIILFVLLTTVMLPVARSVQGVLWVVLAIALYFLAVVNLAVVWWVVGIGALGTLIFSVTRTYFGHQGASGISIPSLFVVAVCALFLFGPSTMTAQPALHAQVGELDVRPSWQTTATIARTVLGEHGLFGAGPGTFSALWSRYMPDSIASTQYWLDDFQYGVGLVPTSVLTVGVLGILAWLLFLGTFLYQGLQSLVLVHGREHDTVSAYLRTSAFIAATYLWLLCVLQVPSPALVLYAFLFTGLFVASLSFGNQSLQVYKLSFQNNQRVGFVVTFLLVVVALASIGGAYGYFSRLLAYRSFEQADRILSTGGDLNEGEHLILSAINLYPSDVYYRFLSNIDLTRFQRVLNEGKTPEEIRADVQTYLSRAVANAQKATELDPNNYQNWLNLGQIYQMIMPIGKEGAAQSARDALERALTLRSASPQAELALGKVLRDSGNVEEARSHVERAISLRNQYTEAILLLAQIQLEENDTENAIRSVQTVTYFEPQNPVAFFQLGLLYYGTEDYLDAAQAFDHAVTIAPDYANSHYFLGLTYWRLGDSARAQAEFEQVQASNPDNAEVRTIISNLRAGMDPFDTPTTAESDIQGLNAPPVSDVPVSEGAAPAPTDVAP